MKNNVKKEKDFLQVVSLIQSAKRKALLAVNTELIELYWNIGSYISKKIQRVQWGESIVKELADFITQKYPELKGYSDKNLWRMKQFYEAYSDEPKLSPLVRQLSWTHNMVILARAKSLEEREFYVRLSIAERYSKRELERQLDSGYFERSMISTKKLSPVVRQLRPELSDVFRDTYIFDFLSLPDNYSERDLQSALMKRFKDFVLEFGKDFAFVGEEYKTKLIDKKILRKKLHELYELSFKEA